MQFIIFGMKKYKSLELFAGAGGLALGLKESGFEHIGILEIDKYACQTLSNNFKDENIIHEDIKVFANQNLKELLNLKEGELDLLSGGIPCQTFSVAGKRAGIDDDRGQMFIYYSKVLEQLKPKLFLVENVKGLKSHNNGKTLEKILSTLKDKGYTIKWAILNAVNYLVPQKRERMVIIGIRNDLYKDSCFEFPKKSNQLITLKDVLNNVPTSDGLIYSKNKKKIMSLVPEGGCWVDLPEDIAKEYMKSCYFQNGGRRGIARRLSWNEPSLTLTCSPAMKQTERCHPSETRPLNIREYARIQTFPDSWTFFGSINNQYKQIGNAVPVKFAKAIGDSLVKCLNSLSED